MMTIQALFSFQYFQQTIVLQNLYIINITHKGGELLRLLPKMVFLYYVSLLLTVQPPVQKFSQSIEAFGQGQNK
jgi:hypothetical protein